MLDMSVCWSISDFHPKDLQLSIWPHHLKFTVFAVKQILGWDCHLGILINANTFNPNSKLFWLYKTTGNSNITRRISKLFVVPYTIRWSSHLHLSAFIYCSLHLNWSIRVEVFHLTSMWTDTSADITQKDGKSQWTAYKGQEWEKCWNRSNKMGEIVKWMQQKSLEKPVHIQHAICKYVGTKTTHQ